MFVKIIFLKKLSTKQILYSVLENKWTLQCILLELDENYHSFANHVSQYSSLNKEVKQTNLPTIFSIEKA